jgi:hypothetical protein
MPRANLRCQFSSRVQVPPLGAVKSVTSHQVEFASSPRLRGAPFTNNRIKRPRFRRLVPPDFHLTSRA